MMKMDMEIIHRCKWCGEELNGEYAMDINSKNCIYMVPCRNCSNNDVLKKAIDYISQYIVEPKKDE